VVLRTNLSLRGGSLQSFPCKGLWSISRIGMDRLRLSLFALLNGGGSEIRPLRWRVRRISRQAISLGRPFFWNQFHFSQRIFEI